TIGTGGRSFDSRRAVVPDSVKATATFALVSRAALAPAPQMAAGNDRAPVAEVIMGSTAPDSAVSTIRAIVRTASTGYRPAAVSADSITASVPSSTALATSEASALVGRGFSVMDSNICVAVITITRRALAVRMIRF